MVRQFAASHSHEWTRVLDSDGLIVLCTDGRSGQNTVYPLHDDQGVVLGRIFERRGETTPATPAALSDRDATKIVDSGGRHLVSNFWGRYVAFWQDDSNTAHVLRDPSGTFPCYHTNKQGVHIYFSWIEDCLQLASPHFSINWDYLSALLAFGIVESRFTGLQEVTQLYPGEHVKVGRQGVDAQLLWTPAQFVSSDAIEDHGLAETALRDTVRYCVHAWASCYERILLRMSGGIDSTIVLTCLKDAPTRPSITGLTHYLPHSRSDERPFARLAANRAGCPLVECERTPKLDIEPLLEMHLLPEPYSFLPYTQNRDGIESRIAAEHGASALFSGGCGDQIFFQGRVSLAASDCARRFGLGKKLLLAAHSAARLERLSVWNVLRSALSDAHTRRPWEPLPEAGSYRQLLAPAVISSVRADSRYIHPWLEGVQDAPIGKQWHVDSLISPPTYYDARGNASDPEYVHPLQSQPLLELSLRIPTYVLTNDGWDRSLARRAFRNEMPAEIVTRRTKGALDDLLEEIFERNRAFIKQTLLDGVLVQRGLVDRRKLEGVLNADVTCAASPLVEVMHYLTVESWIRSWDSSRAAVAA